MKKLIFISSLILTLSGFSQSSFDINFERTTTPSLLNNETDSLFNDKAEIKIFEINSVSSVEIKYYDYADSTFTEAHSSTISVSSISDTPCSTVYCAYKLNPSVIIINLGNKIAIGPKHKVYLKINGAPGKGNLIKEVEL